MSRIESRPSGAFNAQYTAARDYIPLNRGASPRAVPRHTSAPGGPKSPSPAADAQLFLRNTNAALIPPNPTEFARSDARILERAAHRARGLRAVRARRRHVIRVVRHPEAGDLAVDLRPTRDRPRPLLEHEHTRALAHHEAVAILVERA